MNIEWSGLGLPPVGSVCEVRAGEIFPDYDWVKIKVVYIHEGEVIGVVDMPGEDMHNDIEKLSAGYCNAVFRPVRSEADKARDSAIIVIDAIRISVRDDSEIAEEIYDAIAAGDIPGIKIE
ncbi:Uncharacterised protein [Klebsiella pneumoniae]|uniref:hypothetical protein n=1 Tax=Klebsiella pneumoniae TaxID=573 RepID=UPI0010910240|nr:hypothetical protein [Klebsiella pneumoniae]VGC53854.1 Uncharacterised protein [Klebsiella pneumoniae]